MSDPQHNELIFPIDEIRPLLDHTLGATAWQPTCGQTLNEETPGPGLWLVHDCGIYLMSNGDPGLLYPGTRGHKVVYAKGFDPTLNPDFWPDSVAAVGGSDFTEFISAETIQRAFEPDSAYLSITVDKEYLSFKVYKRWE